MILRHYTKPLHLGVFWVFLLRPPTGVSVVLARTLHKTPCTMEFLFTTPPPALELNTSIRDQRVPNNLRCKH